MTADQTRHEAFVSDIAFTPAVKAAQERHGSRAAYQRMAETTDWAREITPDLRGFLAERDSFYMATVSSDGRPYIQHRGGPKGVLQPLGPSTLGFADFAGNRQYLSVGNLDETPYVSLFLMDYPNKRRVKIWGRARIVEDDATLMAQLADPSYRARVERAVLVDIDAWDVNCPQHIQPRYVEATVSKAVDGLRAQLSAALEENARLKAQLSGA